LIAMKILLFAFLVQSMLITAGTILVDFDAFLLCLFILGCRVVPAETFRAHENYFFAH
jgi:hypothetical protein